MRLSRMAVALLVAAALLPLATLGCRTPQGDTKAEKRASVRQMRDQTIRDLKAEQPAASGLLDKSVGYAAFTSIGTNLGFVSTARGYGVLRDKRSGGDTYMEMLSLGGGLGVGVKDFRVIFIFTDAEAMDRFVEQGLDFGGQAEAAAQTAEDEGIDLGAAENVEGVAAKVHVFQMTEAGLALQATLQGTQFKVDEELN